MAINWSHLRLTLGQHGRLRCEPSWRLEPEWSDRLRDFDFWLVWAGRGTMRLRDRRLALRPGTALWMRPGGLYLGDHDAEHPLGVSFMHFDLVDERSGERPAAAALPPEAHELSDTQYADGVLRRAIELLGATNWAARGAVAAQRAAATALMRGLLIDFETASRLAAEPTPRTAAERHHREVVAEAAARLAGAAEAEPAIAELAREAGYSVDHFSRVFRQVMGQSPRDYQVTARIDRARQLLSESSLTVSQIADALGYRDVFFFSRQFKQRTGRSPTRYRRGAAARS